MKNLEEKLLVSRETIQKLKEYQSILVDWQSKMNLVSKSSLLDAWNRHFLDSAQLFQYIPQGATNLIDFGSGAGFPGLVLAIIAEEKTPYLKITLVESIKKKTLFLNEVCDKLGLKVNVENRRIEDMVKNKYDVITSRAMCSTAKLLNYSIDFCNPETICIFPKGRTYNNELQQAKQQFDFVCNIKNNQFSEDGKILLITNIRKKGE